ncbi:MAG: helix-turn-helix domain-containing protein [Pseudomonadota bacterium]|nr:DNA replication initiation protein [Afipia sp.]
MLEVQPPAPVFSPSQSSTTEPHPDEICRLVAGCVAFDFGLDAAALETGLRGSQRMAFARQIAMYLAHVGFGLSFEIIGHAFGRDRTTVAHACRVVEDGRDDIWFDCRVATLELICRAAAGGDVR